MLPFSWNKAQALVLRLKLLEMQGQSSSLWWMFRFLFILLTPLVCFPLQEKNNNPEVSANQ